MIESHKIIGYYLSGLTIFNISKIIGYSKPTICKILKNNGFKLKSKSNGKKLFLSDEIINEIISLYTIDNIGGRRIGKLMCISQTSVMKILRDNGVRIKSISEGTSLGQVGRKDSDEVKLNKKLAQQKLAKSGNRKQTGGYCKFFIINGISCQGTYEKWYVEHVSMLGSSILSNAIPIDTPYGIYYPDFQNESMYIEIKSTYTYKILMGLVESRFTKVKSDIQYKKIVWVSKNVKPVKIVIVNDKKTGIENEIIL